MKQFVIFFSFSYFILTPFSFFCFILGNISLIVNGPYIETSLFIWISISECKDQLSLNNKVHYLITIYRNCLFFICKVFDECSLSDDVREEMSKCYPDAKRAQLKRGGNFPYLSKSTDVNLFLQVRFYLSCFLSFIVVF